MVTDSYISGRCRYRHAPVKASTTSVQYAYSDPNDNSRLTSMTYPNGRILICGYNDNALDDAIGRLDYLADAGGAMAGHLADYQYVGLSTPVSQAFANGVTENITFTNFGQTAEVNYVNTSTSTSTDDFAYGYDADGNVLYKNNMLSPASSELYHANSTTTGDDNSAYDPLNRLVAFARGTLSASGDNGSSLDTVASASATQNWSLNAVGDQSSVTTNGTTTSNATNSQNQLTGFGSASLVYDNNGNITTDENGRTLVYDAWNRLVSVSSGTTVLASYSYDGTGRRTTQTEGGVTTDLYYSNQWQVLEERQGSTATAQYVWGPFYINQLILRDSGSSSDGELGITGSGLGLRLYVQQDADWNVTAVTDVSGSVQMRLDYSAYGVATVLNADWSTGTAAFGSTDAYGWIYCFQGGRYDPVSGKINFQERDYDAATCVWQEQDPAGYVNGLNYYEFVNDTPTGFVDPGGMRPQSDVEQALIGKLQNMVNNLNAKGKEEDVASAQKVQSFITMYSNEIAAVPNGAADPLYLAVINQALVKWKAQDATSNQNVFSKAGSGANGQGYVVGPDKCNLFVAAVIADAGGPTLEDTGWHSNKNPPSAKDWSGKAQAKHNHWGWYRTGDPGWGSIISEPNDMGQDNERHHGKHVGIYLGFGLYVSASGAGDLTSGVDQPTDGVVIKLTTHMIAADGRFWVTDIYPREKRAPAPTTQPVGTTQPIP